ncbi:multidrug efflux SMR transporter [Bacillus sp. REN10]|uniref:DMT family transporter n=1 Tax=Bacillus sp. REN10 TaxID=2782541 RepID=UPI00193B1B25|nr:multidrug efflux SMR transporter [Bacillus sp. REN10]
MNWLIVFAAGILEVVWASGLKYADSILDWIIVCALIAISFIMLIHSYKTIPLAAAYTVFVGIGTVGTYLMGIYLGEPFSIAQLIFLAMLLLGVIGMKLGTGTNNKQTGGESA